MTDEKTAERRRLFLEEMARIRVREQLAQEQEQEDARAVTQSHHVPAPTEDVPVFRSAHVPRPQFGLVMLVILCLALTFPVFGYIQREARAHRQAQWQYLMHTEANGPTWGPDSEQWRLARLRHARAFFGLPDIVAVHRGDFGMSLFLKPGLSKQKIIDRARRVRGALSAQSFPTHGPLPWRIGVCCDGIPCTVAVVRVASPGASGSWHVIDEERLVK